MNLRFARPATGAALVLASFGTLSTSHAADRSTSAAAATPSWLRHVAPELRSADALVFGGDGTLFIGDSRGSAVFAVDIGDSASADSADVTVPDIDAKIASRLGTTTRDLSIQDMAVHPRSHNVYFSVTRDRKPGSSPIVVRVSKGGRVDVVDLGAARYAKIDLPRALPADSVTNAAGRNWTISAMAIMNNELFVAGLSNEEFSSNVRRIPIPFAGSVATAGLRMYHTHHSRYETQAPVTAFAPYVGLSGRKYLIAAYGCTPVVLFPIDSLRDGAKVTGTTIAELGAGNNVRDIVPFGYQGRQYVLLSPTRRSLQMLEGSMLDRAPLLDERAPNPLPSSSQGMGSWETWGLRYGNVAQQGVLHLADFDERHTLAVQRNVEDGALNLRPLNKPTMWP